MNPSGLLLALSAIVFWTVGDFFIQKGTRTFGNWKTLFIIGVIGGFGMFPFVKRDVPALFSDAYSIYMLLGLSILTLFAALFLFQALKRGKFSIIEPVFGIELPFTIFFSAWIGKEVLPLPLYFVILMVFVGLLLTITHEFKKLNFRKAVYEKGVMLAAIGSVAMGLMNFLTGYMSLHTSPILTMWFVHSFLAIVCLGYILSEGLFISLLTGIKRHPVIALCLGVFDNLAWISYATSMTLLPIAVATTISESYIALSVFLGVLINKEKLKHHQFVGIALVVLGVLVLAAYTN